MTDIPSNLRWACRRGMLELDVLLGNFLEEAYSQSSPEHKALFIKLLKCEDQDLFEWLTLKKIPEDPEMLFMVEKIREHARSRS